MKKNFYNNPLKVIWHGRKSLLPSYLVIIWSSMTLFLILGPKLGWTDYEFFRIESYLSSSITGLSFTLALFVANKNVFNNDELKKLKRHTVKGDKHPGRALSELLAPFVFTSMLFLLTGILSLLVPFLNFILTANTNNYLISIYLSLMVLGLCSLFNLVMTILNDIFHSIDRK
ncbi:hypothetical protein [Carnobacterium inhibens]|uniref:hypothetical protein n=1 Tax=Carnobacterium inhibens TaxID=147709 RepID=UPI00203DB325|nr:hypothetical protein [Carnobacterium inhibens]MCM3511627.1 hypothetical protein [Carnobacterium inhibens]